MTAPYKEDLVKALNREHPHLLRTNTHETCAAFLQKFIAAANGGGPPEWGFTAKDPGERGFTFPNGVRSSHDCVTWLPGADVNRMRDRWQVDIIGSGGAHPAPGAPAWTVHPQAVYRENDIWVDPRTVPELEIAGGGDQPAHVARLGFGWFCLLRALRDWRTDAQSDLEWLETHLNPNYYRVMLFVEGAAFGNPDPWRDAGIGPDGGWSDTFKAALDLLAGRGKKLHATVFGGINFDHRRCCDLFLEAAEGRWDAIEGVEVANEYQVNGFSAEQVRSLGWHLRARMTGHVPLALSSPHAAHNPTGDSNEAMSASFDELYGGHSPADEITIHVDRDHPKWSDPFNFNFIDPHLPKTSGEPRGPGASTGGDVSDPQILAGDYRRTCDAGWRRYTGHSGWSVFNGRLPDQYRKPRHVQHPWQHPNMQAICEAWRAIREGGSDVPRPYLDEHTWWKDYIAEVKERYRRAGKLAEVPEGEEPPPPDWESFMWFSRMGHSQAHADAEAAKAKHLRELDDALGLS